MHEWALAEAVVSTASQIADEERLNQVHEVKIKVGELQQIDLEILRFALSQLRTPKLRDAKFTIRIVDAKLECRVCSTDWAFNKNSVNEETAEAIHFVPEISHTYIRCPSCNSPDFKILEGRGVWLESVRGVR